jgi:hypothetical protein
MINDGIKENLLKSRFTICLISNRYIKTVLSDKKL